MSFKVNIDSITLDIITTRLKGVVPSYNILKWLGNFEESEIHLAIAIIRNLTVFTAGEIEEIYHNGLVQILKVVPKEVKIAILPIGTFGKSGSMMTYLLRKTNAYKCNSKKICLCSKSNELSTLDTSCTFLILLDDFVGTGKSVTDYFESDVSPHIHRFGQIHFLGVAAMEVGKGNITPLFKQLFIPKENVYKKAFSSDGSYFGHRKHIPYRKLAFAYGSLLVKPIRLKSGDNKYANALGFGNSQALVSFFYGSPNNTLPIIWQGDFGEKKWFPLIPRFSEHKMQLAKAFRKKLSFELSLFKELSSQNLIESFATLSIKRGSKRFTSVSHIDFSLYGILKLQREGFHEFNICQRLGISYNDYTLFLEEGKKRGLFDARYRLTERGLELYEEANICIKKSREIYYEDRKTFELKNINYIPHQFNGRS